MERENKNIFIHPTAIVYPNVILHENTFIGPYCIIGEPTADYYKDPENHVFKKTEIGANSIIRSHSVVYEDVTIGENFQTGHNVTIREESRIGHDSAIGTLCDIQGKVYIGNYVHLHSNVHIGQLTTIKDYVWIYPYVVTTNDPYPPMGELVGCTIEEYANVATGTILLPGTRVGKDTLIGAGSVVTKDIEDEAVAMGVPAKVRGRVRDIKNERGECVYPWKNHLKTNRGYPWQNDN